MPLGSSVVPVDDVERLVRQWLATAVTKPAHPSARRLADVLQDKSGLEFTVGFIDRVIRPEDVQVAARSLRELVAITPRFLPWYQKAALRLGAMLSVVAPWFVIPVARKVLRKMVGHLLIDATDSKLGDQIARIKERGVSLNINLLGEAVLGEAEADRRLAGTTKLLQRPDVDYVSIKVSSPVAPHSPWSYDHAVEHVIGRLLPLYQYAASEAAAGRQKFINLDMEEYHDLDITLDVFTQILDREDMLGLEAGIVLQAYLPDALGAMIRLQEWSAARRARGGAPIKVRLVKGANLPMERVESSLHGWPLATWSSKQESDTNYKRVLHYALQPEHAENVRLGVAGHNLFDVAYAWLLAGELGVRHHVVFEMLLGMAEGQVEAVRETVGGLLLYVPVVHPREFDVAIAYLVRRLEEGASQDNFMSAVFDLHTNESLFARERARFVASLEALEASGDVVPTPNRTQDRRDDAPAIAAVAEPGFGNTPDTDPSLPGNRAWAAEIIARIAGSTVGEDLVKEHTITTEADLTATVETAVEAGTSWGAMSGAQRGAVLRRAAAELERRRAELLEVMGSECGKTLDQSDPEVSEAVDFARYYAFLAEQLDEIDGAVHQPVRLTVVTPPWNFPVAIPAGSTLAALAAGSAVVIKPATQARRCGSVMVDALWAAGVPREVLRLVHVDEGDLGRQLIAHPSVDRLILTGAFETAQLFRSFRPDLELHAETSGKNAIVITPNADLDLAVKDLVASAFGHAGQKCSAASLAILVGSVATSRRFRDQLVDAVTSLKVGYPSEPTTQMGPIIEPAAGKLLRGLTELGEGEQWLVQPRQLDETGRLWSPGVRTGVRRGSQFHLVEYFGPVLGLIEAADLDEALAIQNQVDYGLTAGLHSLDRDEIDHWLEHVEAGNVYVNRGITGAIVRRQPFGGWKKSAVGAGTKAGGPNYLVGLSDWKPAAATRIATPSPRLAGFLQAAGRLGLDSGELDFLRRSLGSDAAAWQNEFGLAKDVSALTAERNHLRYRPVPAWIRYDGTRPVAELLRVVAAGLLAGSSLRVSAAAPLPAGVAELLARFDVTCVVEDRDAWRAALRNSDVARVRVVGDAATFAEDSEARVEIALYGQGVVEAGHIELLTFVREQAVAVTAHRFGSPTTLVDGLIEAPQEASAPIDAAAGAGRGRPKK